MERRQNQVLVGDARWKHKRPWTQAEILEIPLKYILKMIKCWHRLSREGMESLSLKTIKFWLDLALNALLQETLFWAEKDWMISRGSLLSGSLIPWPVK